MANRDRNAILSHLRNLMMHIIKWKSQEQKRSNSWGNTIRNSRKGIKKVQKKKPSLNDKFLNNNWGEIFNEAKKEAEKEMTEKSKVKNLTWKEVFINKYTLIGIIVFLIIKLFD